MGRLLIATRQQQWSTQMALASRVLQKLQWKRLSETDLQWQRLMTSSSSKESKWDHCGFVFSEFFLEKEMQLQSYPNSMQWCLGENLSPPYPICAHHRSESHQCFTKTGQKKKNHLFSLLWPCGSPGQHLFCALDEQTTLKGPDEYKSQICVWEQRLFISRILCCRVAERTSSTWFLLNMQCAWQKQDRLAQRWRTQGMLSAYRAMSEKVHLCWEQTTLPLLHRCSSALLSKGQTAVIETTRMSQNAGDQL